jgi:hypothetical protein
MNTSQIIGQEKEVKGKEVKGKEVKGDHPVEYPAEDRRDIDRVRSWSRGADGGHPRINKIEIRI